MGVTVATNHTSCLRRPSVFQTRLHSTTLYDAKSYYVKLCYLILTHIIDCHIIFHVSLRGSG